MRVCRNCNTARTLMQQQTPALLIQTPMQQRQTSSCSTTVCNSLLLYDVRTNSRSLKTLRNLFNRRTVTRNTADTAVDSRNSSSNSSTSTSASASAAAAVAGHSPPVAAVSSSAAIPSDYRAYLRWGSRWVEVIDDDSLQAALEDVHYQAARRCRGSGSDRSSSSAATASTATNSSNNSSPSSSTAAHTDEPILLQFRCATEPPPSSDAPSVPAAAAASSSVHADALAHDRALSALSSDLIQRLQFLIHDLLKLTGDDRLVCDMLYPLLSASSRGSGSSSGCSSSGCSSSDEDERIRHSSIYLSSLYFTLDERRLLYGFPTASGDTLAQVITARMLEKFRGSGNGEGDDRGSNNGSNGSGSSASAAVPIVGAHVCSSHDLAPLLRSVFRLDHAFYKDDAFKRAYAKFEKKLKKQLEQRIHAAATVNTQPAPASAKNAASVAAAAATDAAPATAFSASIAADLPADTPQLVKLLALQSEQAQIVASGQQAVRRLAMKKKG